MQKAATQRLFLAMTCLAACFAFVPAAGAATAVITNCVPLNGPGPNYNLHVNINQPADDIVLQCGIQAQDVIIRAHSITVDGSNGGSIQTSGIAGMRLFAGLDSMNNKCVAPNPTGATINILGATLEDQNSNGGENLKSCWNVNVTPGSKMTSIGEFVRAECLNAGCQVNANGSFFFGNRILFFSQGDMTLGNSVFQTIGPFDQHTYISYHGNLFAGEDCTGTLPLACPPGGISASDACNFCQECHGRNSFSGGVESQFFAFAEQFVDLSGACITIAEHITITADGRDSVPPYASLPEPPRGAINLTGAELRDDFGKTGYISVTAHPALMKNGTPLSPDAVPFLPPSGFTGDGTINIDNAIVVDDGAIGGGPDPKAVAFMNGFRDAVAGNCPDVTPTCTVRAIPARGWIADTVSRGSHHVVNAALARCDS